MINLQNKTIQKNTLWYQEAINLAVVVWTVPSSFEWFNKDACIVAPLVIMWKYYCSLFYTTVLTSFGKEASCGLYLALTLCIVFYH